MVLHLPNNNMKWILIMLLFTSCATVSTVDNMKFADKELIVVNIQLNGVNERFLVDTGSSSSYISTDFLRRNKLIIDYNKRIIYKSKN